MAGAITAGMDVEQVRQLAVEMNNAAEQIQAIGQRITGLVEGAPWVGQDYVNFHTDWQGNQLQRLGQVVEALHAGSQVATTNATDQESTSSR